MSTEINIIEETTGAEEKKLDVMWLVSSGLITVIAIFLRFFWLGLKPFHHDEGVNGFFLTNLFRDGVYKYDPANYHGPTLYYVTLAFTKVFGLETLPVRWSVAIFGVLTVVLALFLKRYIGKTGALFAALFLALSPGMVFISRYFIHEMLFVFFSLAVVVAMLFFLEKRKAGIFAIGWMTLLLLICFLPSTLNLAASLAGESTPALWSLRGGFFIFESILVFFVMRMLLAWNNGTPIYLLLASSSVILLFATKETGFITIGTMLIACVCIWIWRGLVRVDLIEKNKYVFIFLCHVAVFAGGVYYLATIIGGAKWFYETFTPKDKPEQYWVLLAIAGVAVAAIAAWIVFLAGINKEDEKPLGEPAGLTWSGFREKLGASNTYEVVMVQGALLSISTMLLWLFVRVFAIALGGKTLWGALKSLVLTNADYGVLAFVVLLLALSIAIWRVQKPKPSADLILLSVSAFAIFIYVGLLFFSSLFTYSDGVGGAFQAYLEWGKTGKKDHTQNGILAYVKWLSREEGVIIILSVLGTLIAVIKAKHRFAMFAGLWAFGLFAAYTIIPYKTPWLALSFLLPMCIIGGYAINELVRSTNVLQKILGAVLAVGATGVLVFQTYELNFVRYDDNDMPYIYAHTSREFLEMIKQIEYYAEKSQRGKEATIEIVSPDYWPMVWYMRDYKKANFHGQLVDANTAEMIVAKTHDQDEEVIRRYSAHYKYVGTYALRPGVDLVLLVKKDLAERDAKELYKIQGDTPFVKPEPPPPVKDLPQ